MSYVKLPLVVSDYAVGLQTVDQAIDNNAAIFEQLDAKHVTGTMRDDVFLAPGKHDDVLIARTVADFSFYDVTAGSGLFATVSGPSIFEPPQRIQTGQWRINLTTPQIFGAVATVKGSSAGVPRYATCFVYFDQGSPYVVVSTWLATGGVLADYDFSLVIWSEGVA